MRFVDCVWLPFTPSGPMLGKSVNSCGCESPHAPCRIQHASNGPACPADRHQRPFVVHTSTRIALSFKLGGVVRRIQVAGWPTW